MPFREVTMKFINGFCLTLSIIGAINWGIIGTFDFNIVSAIFGNATFLSRLIYALVGLSGLYLITFYGFLSREEV